MSDNPPTPPTLYQAELGPDQLDALFADLERGAQVVHVQVRLVSGSGAQDRQATLSEARQLLQDSTARAVQIRYRFEQELWCDTLMVLAEGVRIVRTKWPEPG